MNSRLAVHLIVLLSGVAGLGYQVLWVRMLSTSLGHEVFAVLAILAAFFGGLALGAWFLDREVARAERPAAWYAGLEAVIGLWALALIWLIPMADGWFAGWIGLEPTESRRWGVTFGATLVLLLPATVAMGATLPAAERMFAEATGGQRGIGGIYAANTLGAMVGALATVFVVAPALGFSTTLMIFAGINLACALAALLLPNGRAAHESTAPLPPLRGIPAVLFLTGLLGIGFEVAAVRALAQILENTVYAFAAALAVYLFGTALGAALWQARRPRPALARWLIPAVAFASLAGTVGVYAVEQAYVTVRAELGPGTLSALAGELAGSALVLFLPSLASGALFADLAQRARQPGGGLGTAISANMLGAALAPVLVGLILIPRLDIVPTLAVLSAGYALLILWPPARPRLIALPVWAAAPALAAAAFYLAPSLITPPPGGKVLREIPGTAATVNVTEDLNGGKWLRVNNSLVMGGTASYKLDRIQGHAILMQHPKPRRALFLGVGTGATVAAAAAHRDLEATAVELLPAVLDTIPDFEEAEAEIAGAGDKIRLKIADARRWVRADPAEYDVIIADTYHPAKDGVAMLYTVEHFTAIRARLGEGGVFAQWLPLHQLDLPTLRTLIRTFQSVFPEARLHVGNFNLRTPLLALIGQREGAVPRLTDALGARVTPTLTRNLKRTGLGSPFALYGGFLGGPEDLAAFAGDGPLNTDDHPRVLFEAPASVYAPMGPPLQRLLAVMEAMEPEVAQAVSLDEISGADAFTYRLEKYWEARAEFLRVGARVRMTGNVAQDIEGLGPALVQILRISPDFDPAYEPVLQMARQMAQINPRSAETLLTALERANPARPDAAQLRRMLFGG